MTQHKKMGLLYNYIAQVLMVIAQDDNQCLRVITIYYKD